MKRVDTVTYRRANYDCACGWSGSGRDAAVGELSSHSLEVLCPTCSALVGTATILTRRDFVDKSRALWEELSDEERKEVLRIERARIAFESRRLEYPAQLADLPLDRIAGLIRLGLTAGASAPEHLVQEVVDRLEREGWLIQEVVAMEEDVRFQLPNELFFYKD